MSELVGAILSDRPVPQPFRCDHRWVVETASGVVPIAEPRPRVPAGRVASSGADTAAVLAALETGHRG